MQTIEITRKDRLKPSFATRRVAFDDIRLLDTTATDLAPGDVLLARIDKPGHHQKIERPDGRKALLLPGDEVLIAAGARYAPDQFEALAPTTVGPAHLVAAGGIAGNVVAAHSATRAPIIGFDDRHWYFSADRRRSKIRQLRSSTGCLRSPPADCAQSRSYRL